MHGVVHDANPADEQERARCEGNGDASTGKSRRAGTQGHPQALLRSAAAGRARPGACDHTGPALCSTSRRLGAGAPAGRRAAEFVPVGRAATEIAKAAADWSADLIVITA